MSNRTEQEIKRDIYNILMKNFIEMYDECTEYVTCVDADIEWNRKCFYDMLSANGIFCLRNNPEADDNSIRLDDYITSLSHILAEERQLCIEDMELCEPEGYEEERREEEALAKHLRERAREEEECPDFPNEPWV
jgi:hypothetical protein